MERARIMVVDDEPGLRDIMRAELLEAKYDVVTAGNGLEALAILESESIDLVISDIRMPGLDGIDLLRRIRSSQVMTPTVLLVTGYSDITTAEAYDLGAAAVFEKPVDYDKLILAVETCLQPPRQRWAKRDVRFSAQLKVELKLLSLDTALQAQRINIGQGGMFIALDQSPPLIEQGIEFSFEFQDPDLSIFAGRGICRWVRDTAMEGKPLGIGIEFIELEPASLKNLMTFLGKANPTSFIPLT